MSYAILIPIISVLCLVIYMIIGLFVHSLLGCEDDGPEGLVVFTWPIVLPFVGIVYVAEKAQSLGKWCRERLLSTTKEN